MRLGPVGEMVKPYLGLGLKILCRLRVMRGEGGGGLVGPC